MAFPRGQFLVLRVAILPEVVVDSFGGIEAGELYLEGAYPDYHRAEEVADPTT